MFTRVLKMSFWVSYDHLGKLLMANICCALLTALPFACGLTLLLGPSSPLARIAGILLAGFGLLVLPVALTALLYLIKQCIETGDAAFTDFYTGIRLWGGRAFYLGLIYALLAAVLAAAAWFYPARLSESVPLVGYVLGGFAGLALAVLALSALYAGPALVNRPTGPVGALQMAVVLVLDKPLFTLFLASAAGGVVLMAAIPPVLAFMAYFTLAALQGSAYEILARYYDARASEAGMARVESNIQGSPADDYLNRSWGDLLHPWKL